jgi:hypothetical protein
MLSPGRIAAAQGYQPSFKAGHLNLDTFSPVDQNGVFAFDRVLKTGKVLRRQKKKGAWKSSWKPVYLVLRPNLLSIYKNPDETNLRGSIALSDITAVARVRKANQEHVFGVFSPSKNYHFKGISERDTADWISKIRLEARADELDMETYDPPAPEFSKNKGDAHGEESSDLSAEDSPDAPGSPEAPPWSVRGGKDRSSKQFTTSAPRDPSSQQKTVGEYSGNEKFNTSQSDFSDFNTGSLPKSTGILSSSLPKANPLSPIPSSQQLRPPMKTRNASQLSIPPATADPTVDPERVIRHGHLLVLRNRGGVKGWKSLWCVLRPKSLTFYKSSDEYSATKIIRMHQIIDAAEIDPVNKNKEFCFQVIVEEKTYRLCAADEEDLAKWLGSLKSVLAKRSENDREREKGLSVKEKGKGIVERVEGMTLR